MGRDSGKLGLLLHAPRATFAIFVNSEPETVAQMPATHIRLQDVSNAWAVIRLGARSRTFAILRTLFDPASFSARFSVAPLG